MPSNTPSECDSNTGNIGARHRAERKLLPEDKISPETIQTQKKMKSKFQSQLLEGDITMFC